jgi:hypothetical protein
MCPVRAERGNCLQLNGITLCNQLLQNVTQLNDIVENQTIGDQVIVTDQFSLFFSMIG